MRINRKQLRQVQQYETQPSKKSPRKNDESTLKSRRQNMYSTTVIILRPPRSLSSDKSARPFLLAATNQKFHHALTNQQFSNINEIEVHPRRSTILVVSYHTSCFFRKLVVFPPSNSNHPTDLSNTLLGLYKGEYLSVFLPYTPRDKPSCSDLAFDDIAIYNGNACALDRLGKLYVINICLNSVQVSIAKTLINRPVTNGWVYSRKKRLVVDGNVLYLVCRTGEMLFQVYKIVDVSQPSLGVGDNKIATPGNHITVSRGNVGDWDNKIAGPGNPIVWNNKTVSRGNVGDWDNKTASPENVDDLDNKTASPENVGDWDEIVSRGNYFNWEKVEGFNGSKMLFMARDYYFFMPAEDNFPGREYENCIVFSEGAFPKYENVWRPGQLCDNGSQESQDAIAVFRLTDQTFAREGENMAFSMINWSPPPWIFHASSKSSLNSVRKSERGGNEGEVQSDLTGPDKEQEGIESDPKDEKMHCDSYRQEKGDEEMHFNTNIEGGASLQEDISPSFFGPESGTTDIVPAFLSPLLTNGGNDTTEQVTSRKTITQSAPRACTTKGHVCDSVTAKFEGFNIRYDLVPTLHKVWRKHGNIIENSILRNGEIIARALESLATMVKILEDNSAQTLSDSQADYLTTALSDLKCICFKVYWLIPFAEKAIKLHKSKPLMDSLNNLSQLSSQVKERKVILTAELAKLDEEESKLNEEMAKVSKTIPFSGKVKLDEPLGFGLT